MVFDPQNLQDFNRRFMQIVQAAVDQSPVDWSGGTLVVEKTPKGVYCTLSEMQRGQAIAVNDQVTRHCQEFADFKRTDNWSNDWSIMTIRYSFEDPSVDYTATREFTYPDVSKPATDPSCVPDADFWRRETANDVWQRSPSLFVTKFILDSEVLQSSMPVASGAWHQELLQLIHRFCGDRHTFDLQSHLEAYQHHILLESVYSTKTAEGIAIVNTVSQGTDDESEIFFEYHLNLIGNRWFLVDIKLRLHGAEDLSLK